MADHSANNSTPAPTPDNNLLTHRNQVKTNIGVINEKKQKILATLEQLKKMENPDRELMAKLVGAFDSISAQEHSYIEVLTDIAGIHGKATEDMASEIKQLLAKGQEPKSAGAAAGGETKKEEDEEDVKAEIEATLREISEVQAAAVAASLVNEQLNERLNMSKSKHFAMRQAREDQSEVARQALEEREKARILVASEKASIEKAIKEREKLRKTVVKKECGGGEEADGEEIEVDEVARIPPILSQEEKEEAEKAAAEREKTLEEKRAEIRARVDAERKRREEAAAKIRVKLAEMDKRKERMQEIRRILSGISQEQQQQQNGEGGEKREEEEGKAGGEEKKAAAAAENGGGEKDGSSSSSSSEQKEAERVRMEIELNLSAASMSLKHLTEMRERLESLQARGEAPTEEDEEMMRRLEEVEEEEKGEEERQETA